MANAKVKNSAELRTAMEAWGLTDQFQKALEVTEGGEYSISNFVNLPVRTGDYIAVMSDGRVCIGEKPDDVAKQAQYTSAPSVTIN